jgi:cyclomaltodextrinase
MKYPISIGRLALLLVAGLTGLRSEPSQSPAAGTVARPTPDWVRQSVIYEIFPRQFSPTGDFAGITARLDDLKALGVDVLWLMPIHPIGRLKAKGSIGSPYAVRDYYAVNPEYGTKDDFRRLVDSAHQRGMKVIIDIVANHTAWDSVMMSNPAFYKQDAAGHVIPPHPEWEDVAGLNYLNPGTRKYMRDMLVYWVREFKLDGYRCDDAADVPTDFWEDASRDLEAVHPGFFMLAEADKPELLVNAFNCDYAWPMLAMLNQVVMGGAPATEIRNTWMTAEQQTFPKGALHMHMSDDHDEIRAVSRYGYNGALAASALMFTLDGIPLIYNGMEVGDSSESSDPALFEKLPVFWYPKGRESFKGIYTKLCALRHQHPALTQGAVVWLENSAQSDVVTLLRHSGTEEVLSLVNLSNRPRLASIKLDNAADFAVALSSAKAGAELRGALPNVELGAYEWRIYVRALKP